MDDVVLLPDISPPQPAMSAPSGKIDYVAQAIEDALVAGRERGGQTDGLASR
jgi:hypothetical protein